MLMTLHNCISLLTIAAIAKLVLANFIDHFDNVQKHVYDYHDIVIIIIIITIIITI